MLAVYLPCCLCLRFVVEVCVCLFVVMLLVSVGVCLVACVGLLCVCVGGL